MPRSASFPRCSRGIAETAEPAAAGEEGNTLRHLAAGLERRLASESARRERAERRLLESAAVRQQLENDLSRMAKEASALREELAAAEEALTSLTPGQIAAETAPDLGGRAVLYVGGQPHQMIHLRACVSHEAVITLKRLCRQLDKP